IALTGALDAVVAHHDALRLRFAYRDGDWCQQPDAVARRATDLDLGAGPLLTARLVRPAELVLVAHHLVIDSVSWRILLDDLATAYGQLRAGQAVQLEPVPTAFTGWATLLAEHVAGGALDEDLPYWRAINADPELPVDWDGECTAGSVRSVSVRLDRATTEALLRQV